MRYALALSRAHEAELSFLYCEPVFVGALAQSVGKFAHSMD